MPEHPSFHISSPFLRLKEFRLLLMFVSFRFIVSLFFSITVLTATAIPGAHPRSTHASIPQLFPSSPHILPQPENTTAVDAILPTCFTQPTERYAPEFLPIKISDCLLVFYAILSDPSAITPSVWDPQVRVFPVWNYFGTCAVGVFAKYRTSRDIFPELLVAHEAALVVEPCVRRVEDRAWGGSALIGMRREFEVRVLGRHPGTNGVGIAGINVTDTM